MNKKNIQFVQGFPVNRSYTKQEADARFGVGGSALTVQDIDGNPTATNVNTIKFTNGSVTDDGAGVVTVTTGSGGGGDVSSNTATSVDSEVAVFSGTGGKTLKRATGSGIAKLTSGVLSTASAGTDYVAPNAAITGATKTKITYDAKGLVTAGADATQDDIGDGTTYKQYSATEKTKLAGIATGATANDTDANLKARANHTGTQTASTISDFGTAADARISAAVGVSVQAYDADLATIASLTATTDNFIQSKAGAWASRTVAQVKSDLGLTGTNSGDQTTIVGITGTKAQFDTAVTDGNFMYVGDAPTSHTHSLSAITDVTSSAAELNILDGATLSTAELNYVDGVTSAIQTQIDAKQATLSGASLTGVTVATGDKVLIQDVSDSSNLKTVTTQSIADLAAKHEVIIIAISDETTALTTGTAKVTFRMPYGMTLSAVRSSVTTAPTGSTLIIDINESGSTILSTKLSIDASEKTSTTAATAAVISDTALADDAEITIDIDQVGSTVAGAGAKVYLIGTRT